MADPKKENESPKGEQSNIENLTIWQLDKRISERWTIKPKKNPKKEKKNLQKVNNQTLTTWQTSLPKVKNQTSIQRLDNMML